MSGFLNYQDPSGDKIVGTGNPLPVTVVAGGASGGATETTLAAISAKVALDGTDATSVIPPTGATGIRGWLSAIFNLFNIGTAKAMNYNGSGQEIFTVANPANVALTSAGTSGSAIPTKAVMLGGSDGTNLQPLQVDSNKILKVNLFSGANAPAISVGAGNFDGTSSGQNSLMSGVYNLLFNGTSWDRIRSVSLGIQATPCSGTNTTYITTATTTAVKASKGSLGTLINAGGSTSGQITIYDSTSASGSIIWAGTLVAGQVLPLGLPCLTGITIVTASVGTIAVSYA